LAAFDHPLGQTIARQLRLIVPELDATPAT
jgi:hypothetical protein